MVHSSAVGWFCNIALMILKAPTFSFLNYSPGMAR